MPRWNVYVEDPYYKKQVILTVTAPDSKRAEEMVLGMRVHSPWGPVEREETVVKVRVLKDFEEGVFRFKVGEEHEVDLETAERWEGAGNAERLPIPPVTKKIQQPNIFVVERVIEVVEEWKPPAVLVGPERKLGVVTYMPKPPEIVPVVPKPPEALYIMPSSVAERISAKLRWWKPEEYKGAAESFRKEWRERIMDSFREHLDKWGVAQIEYSRKVAELKIKEKELSPAELEREKRELWEWRVRKEMELKAGLEKVWAKVSEPPVIGVMDEETTKLVKEIEKRLKMRLL